MSPLLSKVELECVEQSSHSLVDSRSTDGLVNDIPNMLTPESLVPSKRLLRNNADGDEMERGRTVERTPRPNNPLEKAESRRRMKDATVQVDVQGMKHRYYRSVAFFEDPNDPCAAFEDNLLEPCPRDLIYNNVSEMIAKSLRNGQNGVNIQNPVAELASTYTNTFQDIFKGSTSSKALLWGGNEVIHPAHTLNAKAELEPFAKLNHDQQIATESSSEGRYLSENSVARSSTMSLLPAEVLSQIYKSLSPADFNSARHTCRQWYITSLDRSILDTMLKRGGWSANIPNELASNHVFDAQARINDEWLLSKRIARECALGPDWTGNGLCPLPESLECMYTKQALKRTPFIHTNTTDFSEIGAHYLGIDGSSSGISFTVSTCGKFLMVAHGCLVYIYELNCSGNGGKLGEDRQSGALRPVTSVICPRRILACSMDTSSHRYAIAVLLDGRMGLVCDLTSLRDHKHRLSISKRLISQDASSSSGSEYRNRISISSSRSREPLRAQADQSFVFPVIAAEAPQSNFQLESELTVLRDVNQSQIPPKGISADDQPPVTPRMPVGQIGFQGRTNNIFPSCSMPVESSTPVLYTPLCSADDMPRSVALCPQRRCVAFGCSSGIELHWVDALTGQDLNRWFPLTAPSDYLYFLPPRPGVDSAKKLRLISSAGRPDEISAIAERYGGFKNEAHVRPFWGAQSGQHRTRPANVALATRAGPSTPSRDNSDHYRAVPLSDGYHILFTDPATGSLCLGSDAPIGGPTKLLRKIWFEGPQGQGSPTTYSGGNDLRWGVRVVAAYGHGIDQSIWLFSVPQDFFTEIQGEQGSLNLPFPRFTSGTENESHDSMKWWCNVDFQNSPESTNDATYAATFRHDRLWPIQVRGQEIGKCLGVVDLAIDAGPEMVIWAFGNDGLAKTWQMNNTTFDGLVDRKFLVMRDGTIRQADLGDVRMVDTSRPVTGSQSALSTLDQETYDGSTSMASSRVLSEQKLWNCHGGGDQNVVKVDADGDVLMADLPLPESPVYENWPGELFESVGLAQNSHNVLSHPDRFRDPACVERNEVSGQDLVGMLTGVARIDIEIH